MYALPKVVDPRSENGTTVTMRRSERSVSSSSSSVPDQANGSYQLTYNNQMADRRRHSEALIVYPFASPKGDAFPPWEGSAYEYSPTKWWAQVMARTKSITPRMGTMMDNQGLCLFDYTCDETVRLILSFLDGKSLCAARRVCRYLRDLGDHDVFWNELCRAEWGISSEQLMHQPQSHQELYKFAHHSLRFLIQEVFEEQSLMSLQNALQIPRTTAQMISQRVMRY